MSWLGATKTDYISVLSPPRLPTRFSGSPSDVSSYPTFHTDRTFILSPLGRPLEPRPLSRVILTLFLAAFPFLSYRSPPSIPPTFSPNHPIYHSPLVASACPTSSLFLVPGFRRHFLVTFNFRQKLVCCGWSILQNFSTKFGLIPFHRC